MPNSAVWFMLAFVAIGLMSFKLRKPWAGGATIVMSILAFTLKIPSPWCLILTMCGPSFAIVDVVKQHRRTKNPGIRAEVIAYAAGPLVLGLMLLLGGHENSFHVKGSRLVADEDWKYRLDAPKDKLKIEEWVDPQGRPITWCMSGSDGQSGFINSDDVYLIDRHTISSGEKVARQVEAWSGVKPAKSLHYRYRK